METTTAKRGAKLEFVVVTNLAATSVRILNDRGRSGSSHAGERVGNRREWRVIAYPNKLGNRKFYVQAFKGTRPGAKVFVEQIRVIR